MIEKRFGLRIYFAVIAIFAVIIGGVLFIVSSETNGIVSELILNQAKTASRTFANSLVKLQEQALERAEIIARSEDVVGDIKDGNREILLKTLTNFAEGMDYASICDPNGIVLARTHSDRYGDDILGYDAVSSALLTGGAAIAIEEIEGIGVFIQASAVIYDDANMIGVINCYYDLTQGQYLDDFKEKNGCEATLFFGDKRINTTITDEYGNRIIGTKADDIVVETVFENKAEYMGRVESFGTVYEGCYSPLIVENKVIGMLFTGTDIDSTLERQRSMNHWIILIAAVGIGAVGILIAAFNRITRVFTNTLQELSNKEASLNSLTNIWNGMEALLYVSDIETDEIIFVNDKMKESFGINDEAIGEACWKVFRAGLDKRCEFCPKHKFALNPGEPVIWDDFNEITNRYYRHSDSVIDWPDGKKVHLSERYDITDIKQLQDKLLRMSSIVNSSPNFISYMDTKGECIFVNPAASVVTGYLRDELMENYLDILFDADNANYIRNTVIPAIIDSGRKDFEIPLKRKDGEIRFFEVVAFLVEADVNAIGSIAADITEKKRIETEKMDALEKAEYASRAKSEFLSRISHEMRTPMNAIIGMANIAKASQDLEKTANCLDKVDSAAKHLLNIISDILDMSKIESGKIELNHHEFHFEKMLADTVDIINFQAVEKKQKLTVNLDKSVPLTIVSDERRLGQVISNLLANAVKFTPEGGRIALNVSIANETDDCCTILTEVEDDGIGIPKDSQKLLFNSFEQVDGGIARKYGGAGLGLAISKHIVEQMGGSIWLESEPGRGSKFSFTIVAKKGEGQPNERANVHTDEPALAAAGHEEQAGDGRFAGKRAVLIAEDVEINRIIVEEILSDTGLEIECAENGRQAFDMYKAQPGKYGLILMDINMPEVDGHTATQLIRALDYPEAAKVPIIAMTANVFQEDIERCLEVGMDDHIGKPIDADELLDKLEKYRKR